MYHLKILVVYNSYTYTFYKEKYGNTTFFTMNKCNIEHFLQGKSVYTSHFMQ